MEANLMAAIERYQAEKIRREAVQEKLNGRLLMQWCPQLKGPQIGQVIALLRQENPAWEDWVLAASPEQIETQVKGLAAKL